MSLAVETPVSGKATGPQDGAAKPAPSQFLFIALALLLLVIAPRDGVRGGNPIEQTARPYHFDIITWEAQQLAVHLPQLVRNLFPPTGDVDAEEKTIVDYFVLAREWRIANADVQRLRALGTATQRRAAEAELADLERQRAEMEPKVAPIIARHIAEEAIKEGLDTIELGPVRTPFPPVSFEMTRLPNVLVVSPRTEIRTLAAIVLRPGMTESDIERGEAALEARGLSVIVEPTGGFSTYPAMVPETTMMEFTLSAITHEWLHAYFFFGPLGQNYRNSPEMRTVNETAADLGGNEIGARLYQRYIRHLPPEPPTPATQPLPVPGPVEPEPPTFDFTKEMRATRLETEALLKTGKVEEAERYMEERRLEFVRQGYLVRKLNQAYFAFHGSYAEGPGSVSPIGGQVRSLRQQSGSLGAFIQRVRPVGSYEQFLSLLDTQPGR